jgi:SAM-dependent methyltransferase
MDRSARKYKRASLVETMPLYREGDLYERIYCDPIGYGCQARHIRDGMRQRTGGSERLTFLDIGCGTGALAEQLEALDVDVTGIDINEGMLSSARARSLRAALRRADAGDPSTWELGSQRFDAVGTFYGAIHFIGTDARVIRFFEGAHAALKPGGRVLVDVDDIDTMPRDIPTIHRAGLTIQRGWRFGMGRGGNPVYVVAAHDPVTRESFLDAQVCFHTSVSTVTTLAAEAGLRLLDREHNATGQAAASQPGLHALTFGAY